MLYTHDQKKERVNNVKFPKCAEEEAVFRQMRRYLAKRGLDYCVAKNNGWYPCLFTDFYGSYFSAICIPCYSPSETRFFQVRYMAHPDKKTRYDGPAGNRYDNVCFMVPTKPAKKRVFLIVEGPMDALAAAGAGFYGIAMLGSTPDPQAYETVASLVYNYDYCFIIPDKDGTQFATRWQTYLAKYGLYPEIRKAEYNNREYKDLADMPKEAVQQCISVYTSEHVKVSQERN